MAVSAQTLGKWLTEIYREGAGKEKPPISRVRKPLVSQDEELAFERVGLDPDKGNPWPKGQVEPNDRWSLFDLVAFWFGRHGQSLCHGEARKSKLPTCERCATSSSGWRSGRGKTPSMPRFFPHGFMPAVFPASRPVQTVGVALMGDRSPLGKRSGAVAYRAGPVAGMAP
jgi:hypothetical protein